MVIHLFGQVVLFSVAVLLLIAGLTDVFSGLWFEGIFKFVLLSVALYAYANLENILD